MKYLTTALLLCCFSSVFSQNNKHGFEFWGAYISSVQLSEKYSLWNDFHLVTNSFFISRHGLTRHFGKALSLSGGYAWLRTSTSFSNHLIRQEHRPWMQLEWVTKLSPKNNYRIRLRYDSRFRKRIEGMAFGDDFIHQNRLRLMNSLRFQLRELGQGKSLHFNVMNETLFHFGQGIDGFRLDQNRSYLLAGISITHTTFMGGYHLRVLPGTGSTSFQHGITLWVVQRFGLPKK
ncbi:MAG: DUF2490 domain-containing protein [Saprospiraceae bacterium]|nr:DUF2490 domain-containing protein [Saprospiraceae bacterium]